MSLINGGVRNGEVGKKQQLSLPQLTIRYQRFISTDGDETEYLEPEIEDGQPATLTAQVDAHKDVLLSHLDAMRRERTMTDTVVFVGGREIFAHRCVLAAMSPTLCEELSDQQKNSVATTNGCDMMTENLKQVNNARGKFYLELAEAGYDCFEALVTYGYTGRLEIAVDRVPELYRLSRILRMSTCAEMCATYLAKNLSPMNCIGVRKVANKHSDTLLLERVDDFIQRHIHLIIEKSTELRELPRIQVQLIGASSTLAGIASANSEQVKMAEKVLQWLQHDVVTVRDFRIEMLIEKSHLLYFNDELLLHDCTDMDDNTSVGSCDLVQDYKRDSVSRPSLLQGRRASGSRKLPTPDPNGVNGYAARKASQFVYKSQESVHSVPESGSSQDDDEIEWRIIAVYRSTENYLISVAVVHRRVCVLSIQQIDAAQVSAKGGDVYNERAAFVAKCLQESSGRMPLATMSRARCSVGAVAVGRFIIVCGGYDRGTCLRSCERYDTLMNQWVEMPSMEVERGRCTAALCATDAQAQRAVLFVVGGSSGNTDLDSIEMLDTERSKWITVKTRMRCPRTHTSCVSVDGRIYIIGGWSGNSTLTECEVYDATTQHLLPMAPLPLARSQAGVCVWRNAEGRNKIFVAGGADRIGCTTTLFEYDIESDVWSQLPSMTTPRRGCAAVVVNDRLYAIGGSDGQQSLASVEVFDLIAQCWLPMHVASESNATAPPMCTARANVAAVVVDGRIYALGGFNGKLFVNTIERFTPGTSEWCTWTTRNTPPIPEKGESLTENDEECRSDLVDYVTEHLRQMSTS